ncbi:class I SAM-dependent methyltransferase [Amycolatopsis pittospori]|uniref:class I SAM-dependent methyltransferase n=1 Tax=Amycolatopsis pittospori TaxID=2749434 RepID=UPI0015EFEE86|nr:class I SAM-dependent methyltransferase [Amycolatopsis pittospori]
MPTPANEAVPVDYETDPGRFAANVLSTAWFSSCGDVHPEIARRLEGCSLVLDVGGGTGALSRLLMRRNVPTVVADLSSHVSHAPGFAVQADVAGLPFRDGIFDGAAALWMLHHVPDPIEALTEVSRVLAPGGLLAVSASSRWNDPELAWALPRWGRPSSFDAEVAETLLGKVFEVDAVRVWDAPLVTLPDHAAVALHLRGRGLPERTARRLAREVAVPLSLTKRGLVAWARKT